MNLSARIKSWKDYKILFRILSTADTKSFDVEYFERLTSAYFCTGSSSWIDEIQNDSVRMVSTAVRTSYCNRNSVENSIKNSAVSMSLLLEIMSYQPWKHCSKDFLGDFFYPMLCTDREQFLSDLDFIRIEICHERGEECLFSSIIDALKLKSTRVPLSFCPKRQKRQFDLSSTLHLYRSVVCTERHFIKFFTHVFGDSYVDAQRRMATYMCCILNNSIWKFVREIHQDLVLLCYIGTSSYCSVSRVNSKGSLNHQIILERKQLVRKAHPNALTGTACQLSGGTKVNRGWTPTIRDLNTHHVPNQRANEIAKYTPTTWIYGPLLYE